MTSLNDLKAILPSVSGRCTSLRHTLNSNFAQFHFKCRLNSVCLIDWTWHSSEPVENVIETWRRPFHEIYRKVLVLAAWDQQSLCPTCEYKFIFRLLMNQFFIWGLLKRNTECLFLLPKLPNVFRNKSTPIYIYIYIYIYVCVCVCVCVWVCEGLRV